MGYTKKTISRDSISGIWQANDITSGEYSVNQLRSREESRQEALNKAIQADWPAEGKSTIDADAKVYGDAGSRLPRPTDYSSKGEDRFGIQGGSR